LRVDVHLYGIFQLVLVSDAVTYVHHRQITTTLVRNDVYQTTDKQHSVLIAAASKLTTR